MGGSPPPRPSWDALPAASWTRRCRKRRQASTSLGRDGQSGRRERMRHGMVQQLSKRPTNAEHVLALKLLTKVQHAAGDDDQSTACVAYTQEQKLGIAQKQHESSTRTDAVCQGRNHVQQGHGGKIVGEVTQTVAQHQAEQPGCDLVQLVVNLGDSSIR